MISIISKSGNIIMNFEHELCLLFYTINIDFNFQHEILIVFYKNQFCTIIM